MFVAGDMDLGVGTDLAHTTNLLALLGHYAERQGNRIICFRGNHDNPALFREEAKFGGLTIVPDFTVIDVAQHDELYSVLCVGGGVSLNRRMLALGVEYWPDEVVSYPPDCECAAVDVVLTHVPVPSAGKRDTKSAVMPECLRRDLDLRRDLCEEQRRMTHVEHWATRGSVAGLWVSGHLHRGYEHTTPNGITYVGLAKKSIRSFYFSDYPRL